jgi:hypothetical protein
VETEKLDEVGIYNNYLNTAEFMNDLVVDNPIIIGGPDAATNAIIPSLTMKYEPLFFRVEVESRRSQLWRSMVRDGDMPVEERLALFQENKVEYLLLKSGPNWVAEFSDKYPDHISLIFQDRRLSFYKITP